MKKILPILIVFLSCSSLTSYELSGVWYTKDYLHPNDKKDMVFSWGSSFMAKNTSLVIDEGEDRPMFYIGGFGSFPIKEVKEIDGTFEMIFDFTRGGFDIICRIHPINNTQMWIEDIEGISMFPTGENWIYYKLDGPEFDK